MASCLQRVAGHCVRAVSCALLLGACQVYDGDALSTRASATESDSGHNAQRSSAIAACADAACPEDDCAAGSCDLPHAAAVCRESVCQVARCIDGYRDCDGEAENGCEVALDAIDHCGQCLRRCDIEHASARCEAGQCELSECDPGFADCDEDGRSCEAELARDAQHCGSCERQCRFSVESPHASALCDDGSCQLRCERGYGDCDGKFDNGCERALDTASDCGRCGKACVIEHASAQCKGGRCQLAACEPGYADCDADSLSCERSLSDVPSCGGCEQRCELAHAQSRCAERACQIERCEEGFSDCDGAADNGCERDTRPAANGGEGACAPDSNCEREQLGDRQYFFCRNARTWDSARAACKSQRNGDLVQLRDEPTQAYLRMHLAGHVWAGHNDLLAEGTWIWASSNLPFWKGGLNGQAVNGAFVRWSQAEPNGSGRCGSLTADAEMEDLACTVLQPFVCEIGPDLCPEDPKKSDPGQCGCGMPDEDANQDGLAECRR
jgi:hypothetical protein